MIYTDEEMRRWIANTRHPENIPPIIVTKDGYVLDGYHRVQRAAMLGEKIAAVVLDVTVEMLEPTELKLWGEMR